MYLTLISKAKAWMELMKKADTDHNGKLGFEEFKEAVWLAQEQVRKNSTA